MMGSEAYGDSLDWMRDLVVKEAEEAGVFGVDPSALDVEFVTKPVGIVFLVIGLVVLALAAFGIVTSTGRFRVLIYVYTVVTALILTGLTITVICAYADPGAFNKPVKKLLKDSLYDFTGIAGNDTTTLGWNAVMLHFNCCGVDGYEDFSVAEDWVPEVNGIKLVTPIACCEIRKNPPKCAKKNKFEKKTFYDRGCYDPLFHYVAAETGLLLFTVYFLLFMEFLCLFFGVLMTCVMISKSPDRVRVMDFMY